MKISLLIAALLPVKSLASTFPSPHGPYRVKWESSELIDHGRVDPFNSSHPRKLMISQFIPVVPEKCKKLCKVPYMPSAIAAMEDDIISAFISDIGWPSGVLGGLELEVCCDTRCSSTSHGHDIPTIFLGSGLNTTRLFYSAMAQQLASLGYQVIVMDHPYETDVVQFPDGQIVYGGHIGADPNNTAALQFGLDVRTQDTSFVLDHFKIRGTVLIGHSYGGAAAASAMVNESRILGGVNLDGDFWGRVLNLGVPRPFMLVGSEGRNSTSEPNYKQFFHAMDEQHHNVWTRELNIKDSVHGSFWDMSIIGDITGLRDNEQLVDLWFGKATGKRVINIMQAYLGAFVEFSLRGAHEGLLAKPSPQYSDVVFVR